MLYLWFVVDHGRRRILHFNVTAHPTAPWVIQPLREAFSDETPPSDLIHDRDSRPTQSQALGKLRLPAIFSQKVTEAIEHFRVQPKRTAYRSPWQNGTAERWIGSARRERLDHVIVFDESHLGRLLHAYVDSYNEDRVHTELRDSPVGRQIERRPSVNAAVIGLPRVGGLHHRYTWREAA